MRQSIRYQFWIAVAAGLIFFVHLSGPALWDMDEALYSSCAREMLQRGDWVVPWFNGQMFPEKPPLMFWTMMVGFKLFGVNELGARFFSAVLGVATGLVTYHLGRVLFSARVGFWAGLIAVSTILLTISARAATVDMALTFVTTSAFLLFALWLPSRHSPSPPAPTTPWCPPLAGEGSNRWGLLVLMYACIGLAVLAKGPVGMLLPLVAIGLFLLFDTFAERGQSHFCCPKLGTVPWRWWRNLARAIWRIRPVTGLLVIAAVALPWYILVGLRTDWEWPRQFFLEFNLRPFKQPIQGHGDVSSLQRLTAVLLSIVYRFYHIPGVLIGFFPWSVFLGPTLVDTVQRIRRGNRWRTAAVLMACWFGTWFVFWSICKTKLPHYLLPAYPALALLTGCFVDRWLAEPSSLKPWWLRNAWISMIVVGVGLMLALPIVAAKVLPGEGMLGLTGLIPLVGGAWCWRKTWRSEHQKAAATFAVTSAVFLAVVFGFAALRVDLYQNARPMMAAIRADVGADESEAVPAPLATYCFFRESTVYYAGHPVTRCSDVEQLRRFVGQSKPSYIITTSAYEPEIKAGLSDKVHVIHRKRRFLGKGDQMVVLRAG